MLISAQVPLDRLVPHDHPCLIYSTKEEQIRAFVPYLRSGLLNNEKCIYIADESTSGWVKQAMSADGFPLETYIAKGAFTVINKHDAYLKDGRFECDQMMEFWAKMLEDATAAGFDALRAAAEMTWALGGYPGSEQLVEYEARLNYLFPKHKISALCQYNSRRFPANILKGIIHTHPLISTTGPANRNPCFIDPDSFFRSYETSEVDVLLDYITHSAKCGFTDTESAATA